jgi:hypothetical protein
MPAPPVLPPSWMQVLEKIEESLAETVQRAAEREPSPPPDDPAGRDAAWQSALLRLDDRLAALQDCAERAGRAAAAADAALADGADGLDRWLGAARVVWRKVADQAGGAVS